MTATLPSVRRILDDLSDLGATFGSTGGNCMAVEVLLNRRDDSAGYVLVTDLEGPFTTDDLDSDDAVYGFAVGAYNGEGDLVDDDVLYYSPPNYSPLDEPTLVAAVVRAYVESTLATTLDQVDRLIDAHMTGDDEGPDDCPVCAVLFARRATLNV